MVSTDKKIESSLRQRGFKITPQRRAIIGVITRSRQHLTPAALHEKVGRQYPGIGLVTIYRTLEMLSGIGLICEMHTGGNGRSYLMRRPAGHHHHLICSDCGAVADFTGCDLEALERRLSRQTGFKINGHFLEFLGQCGECRRKAAAGQEDYA